LFLIVPGTFVIEYVGELIDKEEYNLRVQRKDEDHYYYMTLDKKRIIDAGRKGNLARFMNHSCQPNCKTEKWDVAGDKRVGLFALRDIKAGEELTFNYNLESFRNAQKKKCECGAPNCAGLIGNNKPARSGKAMERNKRGTKRKVRLIYDRPIIHVILFPTPRFYVPPPF
jgi:SET domain-containing protein